MIPHGQRVLGVGKQARNKAIPVEFCSTIRTQQLQRLLGQVSKSDGLIGKFESVKSVLLRVCQARASELMS